MKIIIAIKEKKIKLLLFSAKKEIASKIISDERNLSDNLLPEIDKFLKKNRLIPDNIEKVEVLSDQGDNFTTTRLAMTVANIWNIEKNGLT